MLQAHAKTVSVGKAVAQAVVIGNKGGAIGSEGLFVGILGHIDDGTVVQVVGTQLHPVIEEVEVTVDTAHPGGGNAIAVAAEAAAAHTHHAATAHHATHHVAGEVVETAVIGVVGIEDDAHLAVFREAATHEGALPAGVVHHALLGRNVVTATGHYVAEDAVHHALLDAQVNHGLILTVVDAGEGGLLALLLNHLHLLDEFGGDVLGGQLRVVQEEGLAVDGNLGDGFTVGGDGAVLVHFHTGELLKEVFQHIVVADLEGRGVVFHRIFLDDDGVTHGAHGRSVQHFQVLFHLDDAQVGIGP